ncbi:MAG: M48 family metalloprotease [Candidatus ainarchaeum sp.]|nr:M48 family metalloprotease [Candidatus ainarchaeum sp.]
MVEEKVSFFDAIESNERKSNLLLGAMFLFSLILLWFCLYFFIDWEFALVIALIISSVYIFFSYKSGMSLIMNVSNARPLKKEEYPHLHHVIEGLSLSAGIPVPKAYIIDDPAPNAFATGTNPNNAAVAVTTGLLETLNQRELTAVMAHEISHIANRDIKYALVAIVVVGFVAIIAQLFGRMFLYSGSGSRKGGSAYLVIIGIILLIFAPIFAQLVRFALSREREYLADANGSKLTRDPQGLSSALEKISKYTGGVKSATDITAPLYFSNPLKGKPLTGLFSTHPEISSRISRLQSLI